MSEKVEVKCPKCSNQFPTKSLILVNCNSCGKKFKRDENLAKLKKEVGA